MSDLNRNVLTCSPDNIDNPQNIAVDVCSEVMVCELNDLRMDLQGHILDVTACLRNVCPGRRISMGIVLHELDDAGNEHARGMKTMLIPAHREAAPRDVLVKNIRFVLPGELDLRSDENDRRRFVARTIVHYADSDYACSVK